MVEKQKINLFDRSTLDIKPLSERRHDLDLSVIKPLDAYKIGSINKSLDSVGERIRRAKKRKAAIILMLGGHVIRSGVQNYIIDLMKRGLISCIAMNGSGMIHDFEFSMIGATTESVARYIKEGRFGLWRETAMLNDIINASYKSDRNTGMGEAVGRYIEENDLPQRSVSLLAWGHRLEIPVTVHVGIGADIIHEHPNCDGGSTGALSYNDFLKFASVVQHLENGVVMNFGSSVTAPEIFLKALSMARNVAHQNGKDIRRFTSLVCDLYDIPEGFSGEPPKEKPAYYFRPWKTMLVRTVADGGESFYVRGYHAETIPALWASAVRGK